MVTGEVNILKYCYWLDEQALAMLKKKMATVKKLDPTP